MKFSLNGYEESVVSITSRLDGWYFGNILLGGLLGMLIIDPLSGAMWKLDQKYLNVNLIPQSQEALGIININDLPEEYKQYLIRIN